MKHEYIFFYWHASSSSSSLKNKCVRRLHMTKTKGGVENRKLLEDLKCTRLPTNTHYDMLGWPFQLTPMSTYTCVIVCVSYYDASPTQAALKSKQSVSGDLGISEYEYLEETSRSWRSSTTTAASRPQHSQQMLLKQTHTHASDGRNIAFETGATV